MSAMQFCILLVLEECDASAMIAELNQRFAPNNHAARIRQLFRGQRPCPDLRASQVVALNQADAQAVHRVDAPARK